MKIDASNMFPFIPKKIMLFHSREKCRKWMLKEFGSYPEFQEADAQTMNWNGSAIVLMEVVDEPAWEDALLVHESYHVVMQHLENMGESNAGEEIVAYMLQCVSGLLIEAHHKWRKKHVGIEDGQQSESN